MKRKIKKSDKIPLLESAIKYINKHPFFNSAFYYTDIRDGLILIKYRSNKGIDKVYIKKINERFHLSYGFGYFEVSKSLKRASDLSIQKLICKSRDK